MNEAERYLEEKINPNQPRKNDVGKMTSTRVVSGVGVPRDQQTAPLPTQAGSTAGKYVMALLACLGIFGVYVVIAASMGWKQGGGYVVMVIVFMAIVGTWKAITRK